MTGTRYGTVAAPVFNMVDLTVGLLLKQGPNMSKQRNYL